MTRMIATNGIRLSLPDEFPLEVPENAGNIIHGNAPKNLFGTTMATLDPEWRQFTASGSFRDFVNDHCSHLIITMANFFRLYDFSPAMRKRYDYFSRALDGYEKPIVLFGLGAQAKSGTKISADALPSEGQRCLKKIIEKTTAISVRGDFTRRVIEAVVGSTEGQVFVTGCPSYYSQSTAFKDLQERLRGMESEERATAVNVTRYSREADQHLVRQAVAGNFFLIEPENKDVHRYFVDTLRSGEVRKAPEALRFLSDDRTASDWETVLSQFIRSRYRLFRHMDAWLEFNREMVSQTVGTRFHVNMASMLSGVPAVWVTHDERTAELTKTLSLPAVSLEQVLEKPVQQIVEEADFDAFLKAVPENFRRFNSFLAAAGLPQQEVPTI